MHTPQYKVLLIEDDIMLTEFISIFLNNAGFIPLIANTAATAIQLLQKHSFDLIVLDLNLPDEDGLVLLRKWQYSKKIPIIVISVRTDDATRVAALELGAADYLTKPFNPQEFLLRITRLASSGQTTQDNGASVLTLSDTPYVAIDLLSRRIITNTDTEIQLTRAEFDILASLTTQIGIVVRRESLIDAISYHNKEVNPNSLGVLIHRLRKKLAVITGDTLLISTLPNLGYRLNKPRK